MPTRLRFLFAIALIAGISGCSGYPACIFTSADEDPSRAIAIRSAAALVADTAGLWRSHQGTSAVVQPSDYPASVRALKPVDVRVSDEGVYVSTWGCYVMSVGVFIRHDPAFNPPASGDPGFSELADNVYWFDAPG